MFHLCVLILANGYFERNSQIVVIVVVYLQV